MRIFAFATAAVLFVAASNAQAREAAEPDAFTIPATKSRPVPTPRNVPDLTWCVDIGSGVSECQDCWIGPSSSFCSAPYISSVVPKG